MTSAIHSLRKRPSTFLLVRHPQPRYASHLCGFALTRAANSRMHSTACQFFAACPPNIRSKRSTFSSHAELRRG
jgi:hypothetical protein